MLILNHLLRRRIRFWRVYHLPNGQTLYELSHRPILSYSFDSTKVAKPIRPPIPPKSWSNLEQVEQGGAVKPMPIFIGRGVGALRKTLATLAGGNPDQRHLFQVLRHHFVV